MAEAFRMPDLGEGIAEAEVVKWLVDVGDAVVEDQPLVEVHTDKAAMELPSPFTGTVLRLEVAEATLVHVGDVLIYVGGARELPPGEHTNGNGPAHPPDDPAAAGDVLASPFLRRQARNLQVDLAQVCGSGPDGRLTEADVEAAARENALDAEQIIPLRGIRRLTAAKVLRAHREVPAVTIVEECDFTDLRRVHLSYLPHVVSSCAGALRERPEFNASIDGDHIILHDRIDIGIATQTDDGLLVPVVVGADRLGLAELGAEVRRLHHAARRRELRPAELTGSTFSVSAAGRRGGLLATPLVNHPEVAILAVHRIAQRPVVRRGEIVVRRIGLVSLTFDHRAADGIAATDFLLDIIRRLEQPGRQRRRTK